MATQSTTKTTATGTTTDAEPSTGDESAAKAPKRRRLAWVAAALTVAALLGAGAALAVESRDLHPAKRAVRNDEFPAAIAPLAAATTEPPGDESSGGSPGESSAEGGNDVDQAALEAAVQRQAGETWGTPPGAEITCTPAPLHDQAVDTKLDCVANEHYHVFVEITSRTSFEVVGTSCTVGGSGCAYESGINEAALRADIARFVGAPYTAEDVHEAPGSNPTMRRAHPGDTVFFHLGERPDRIVEVRADGFGKYTITGEIEAIG